jgi:hypothetical protein
VPPPVAPSAPTAVAAAAAASGSRDPTNEDVLRMCRSLTTLAFDEDDDIDVIISYRTNTSDADKDGTGLLLCEGLSHELKRAGYNPFHGNKRTLFRAHFSFCYCSRCTVCCLCFVSSFLDCSCRLP